MGVGIVLLLVLGATASCSESEPPVPQEFTLNACDLIETATVEALVGEIDSQEERLRQGQVLTKGLGPKCTYYPADTSRAPLDLWVSHGTEYMVAEMESAVGCEETMPIDIAGATGFPCEDIATSSLLGSYGNAVWGEDPKYFSSISFVGRKEGQGLADIAVPMQEAIKDLMKNVDEDSFTPQPLAP